MKILNTTQTFTGLDLTSGEAALEGNALTGTGVSIGTLYRCAVCCAGSVSLGATVTMRVYRTISGNEVGPKVAEVTATAGALAGIVSVSTEPFYHFGIAGSSVSLKVTLESDNVADDDVGFNLFICRIEGLDENGRVDVGKILGGTPMDEDDIAARLLVNDSNKIDTDSDGRVTAKGGGGGRL